MLFVFILLLFVVAALVAVRLRGRREIDRRTVGPIDLTRYMGTWYEIARLDNRFERGMDHVQARYELRPDGRVTVINSGRDIRSGQRREARGKAHTTATEGRLRVSFFWIFYSDYIVLALGDNYEWSLVGGGSERYLWILSRTPVLPSETLERIVQQARRRGYDTENLLFVDQS